MSRFPPISSEPVTDDEVTWQAVLILRVVDVLGPRPVVFPHPRSPGSGSDPKSVEAVDLQGLYADAVELVDRAQRLWM